MDKRQIEKKSLLEQVAKDIGEFDKAIKEVLSDLKNAVANMNDVWDDAQYQQFSEYVEELSASINQDLDTLMEAGDDLKKRAERYLG